MFCRGAMNAEFEEDKKGKKSSGHTDQSKPAGNTAMWEAAQSETDFRRAEVPSSDVGLLSPC